MTVRADTAPTRQAQIVVGTLILLDLAIFTLIAEDLLDGGGLVSRDRTVLTWFVVHRTDGWISAARLVSTLGGFAGLAIVGVLGGLWLWRRGWHVLAPGPVVALVLASLASSAAKALFGRSRPPVIVQEVTVTSAAFPSGHATDAAAFFVAASFALTLTVVHRRRTKVMVVAAGLLLAGLVGLSRLVLGVHWLSDVVAGWSLGSATGLAGGLALWWATATRAPRAG